MTFIYNDFSRELDNTDLEVVKRYEEKIEEFYRAVAGIDMGSTDAAGIYGQIISAGVKMMDGFLGEGASRAMFGQSQSVRKVMEAVCGLNSYMSDISGVIDSLRELGA